MIQIKNVLVATDFSEPAEAALRYGRELARIFNATLQVLHITDNLYTMYGGETYALALPDLQREIDQAVQEQIKSLLTEEDRTALQAKAVSFTAVGKAEAIVAYARTHAIDVIVIGTHGRGALGQLFMGSVAERVVRTANCPVLTVHEPDREFIVPDRLAAAAAHA
jgi:nucleotide-binding universal stress UspA family protein